MPSWGRMVVYREVTNSSLWEAANFAKFLEGDGTVFEEDEISNLRW